MNSQARRSEGPFRVHLRVVIAMLRREMTTRYGNSVGGYFWAVGEPVGMIGLLSLVFSALARTPALGQNFVVFFATGYLAYNAYRTTADQISKAVRGNKALLKYPNVTVYDALVASGLLQFLTNCMITVLILTAAIMLTGEAVLIDVTRIIGAMIAATILAFGVGTLNAVLFPIFPVWERIFKILMRPLFIVSGIFYLPETMPAPVQDALALNPIVHIVATFRQGVYPVYHATINHLEYPVILGLTLFLFGLLALRRYDERLSEL